MTDQRRAILSGEKDALRVCLVAPLVAPLRPAQVGGAQAVLADLARGLVERGDEVEVLAPPGSAIPGVTVRRLPGGGPYPEALMHWQRDLRARAAEAWPSLQAPAYLAAASRLRAHPPDVVHAHALDWPAFYALAATGLPTVHTLHLGPVDPAAAAAAAAAAATRPRPRFVAVSRACARQWRGIVPVDAVIGNGVDPETIPFVPRPAPAARDVALVAGRISPEKGTHLAIAAARGAGLRTMVAGDVYDRAYFDEAVTPLLGPDVELLGAVPRHRLLRLYGRAAVAVVASLWEEPFGMVALEANLAGTPVAGFSRGALPEVVGSAGGVLTEPSGDGAATDVPALAAAIRAAVALDRTRVRRAAARRHPLSAMVDRYRALYRATASPR